MSIGKPIDPAGLEAGELNDQIKAWIETEVSRISQSIKVEKQNEDPGNPCAPSRQSNP